jgi:hypothetical protein
MMTATITEILTTAAASLLLALLAWATESLRARTQSVRARAAIDLAHGITEDVVAELQHTVVEKARAGGQWDAEAKAEVKARAVRAVVKHLGEANVRRLDDALSGGAKEWIATRVEATVARERRGE